MQETVSGYGFRIFHHSPGGRVSGRTAVREPAAWGSAAPPWSVVPGRQGPSSTQKEGLCPVSTSLWDGVGTALPRGQTSKGTPEIPCGSRPCDTAEVVQVLHGECEAPTRGPGTCLALLLFKCTEMLL